MSHDLDMIDPKYLPAGDRVRHQGLRSAEESRDAAQSTSTRCLGPESTCPRRRGATKSFISASRGYVIYGPSVVHRGVND